MTKNYWVLVYPMRSSGEYTGRGTNKLWSYLLGDLPELELQELLLGRPMPS